MHWLFSCYRSIYPWGNCFLVSKRYVEDYVENAAYARAVIHPEMMDANGNIIHDELIYLRKETELDDDTRINYVAVN